MTVVEAPEDASTELAPGQRGTLTIKPGVVAQTAMRALQTRTFGDRDPDVEVIHFGDDHVELAASISLPYPDEPIGTVLDRLREQVAQDVGRAVGRPVRSIDLTVDEFRTAPPARRRRVI